jgi:hypothetical protein
LSEFIQKLHRISLDPPVSACGWVLERIWMRLRRKRRKEYMRFILVEEIDRFISLFEIDVNVFKNVEKEKCYKKQYSNVCSEKVIFVLNVGIVDFPKY